MSSLSLPTFDLVDGDDEDAAEDSGDSWTRQSLIGGVFLVVFAWGLIALSTVRAIQSDGSVFSRVIGVAIPIALASTLVAGAIGIAFYGLRDQVLRIGGWTLLGTMSFTAAVGLNILGLNVVQPDSTLLAYMLLNAAAGGAVLGFLVGVYDGYQRQLQHDLAAERDRARALSQRLEVINRVLRHDIRNQVQIIRSHTENLQRGTESPDAAAAAIQRANTRLFRTADSVRRIEPLLAGEEIDCQQIDIASAARTVGEKVEGEYDALDVEYDLPSTQYVLAPALIDLAIEHVLSNAVVHNDSASPAAEVAIEPADDGSSIDLTVTDNGPGIPDDKPVLEAAEGESQLEHSSGFGLWLVKWIVETADGDLDIRTPEDSALGTKVRLRLPRPPDS